jgi:hypothetical protein
MAPGAHVIGVVKADAYRHGAIEVSRVLCAEGARWLRAATRIVNNQKNFGGAKSAAGNTGGTYS